MLFLQHPECVVGTAGRHFGGAAILQKNKNNLRKIAFYRQQNVILYVSLCKNCCIAINELLSLMKEKRGEIGT